MHMHMQVSLFINSLDAIRVRLAKNRSECLAPPPLTLPASLPQPRMLQWRLSPSAREAIEVASTEVVSLADDCEVRHLEFLHYGKAFIKRCKLHPDFYMQMALQLTMHRMHGGYCATYETGHTRAFYHGRTDTVRSYHGSLYILHPTCVLHAFYHVVLSTYTLASHMASLPIWPVSGAHPVRGVS